MSDGQNVDQDDDASDSAQEVAHTPGGGGPLRIDLPADPYVLRSARVLAADGNSRISALASLALRDPVTSLELIKTANAMFFSADRPSILNVRTAVVRLGSSSVVELLDALEARGNLLEDNVAIEFETLRKLSVHIAEVSSIIAQNTYRDLAETAHIAGLMTQIGHLVACAHLGAKYVNLALNRSRAAIVYKLEQDHHFNLSGIQLSYLRMRGMPADIFYALDRDLQCKNPSQSNLRFIVASSVEFVEAFAHGKLEKYSKQGTLPGKSILRLLKLSEAQHELIFESVADYLTRGGQRAENEAVDSEGVPFGALNGAPGAASIDTEVAPEELSIHEIAASDPAAAASAKLAESEQHTTSLSEDAQRVVQLIKHICTECKTTNDLLSKVLTILITAGPYKRAALIVVGQGNKNAMIHTEVGTGLGKGASIPIDDPLSPLALCLTKLRSFNAKGLEDVLSPFGITSYALSPIRLKHNSPVVLYADCGLDKPLALEARKVFRLVVGLLNTVLPRLPGGLPPRLQTSDHPAAAGIKSA